MNSISLSKLALAACGASLAISACGASSGGSASVDSAVATAVAQTVGAAKLAEPSPSPLATGVPATVVAVTPTVQQIPPTATPAPPTDTPAPPAETAIPPTDTPAPPTPTLEPPIANTIPNDHDYEDELPFSTTANDPRVGQNNGDGIESVTFQFFGPGGQEVYTHKEMNPLYCAFGGGDDGQDCDSWRFSEHDNRWPNDRPAQPGAYTLVVTIQAKRGGVATDARHFTLSLIQPEQQPLVMEINPRNDSFGDELDIQVLAHDPNVGDANGAGIASVMFQIFDHQGQQVHMQTERNVSYCAFGGGDNGQPCNVWRFSENNNQWSSGIPVQNGGSYTLRATVTAASGQEASQELSFTIQL
jgi:hypothetical protein